MADEEKTKVEDECDAGNNKLTAKQKKNKKKKEAAKKKKQEQREKNDASSQSYNLDNNLEEKQCQETKTPQEKFEDELAWCISQLEIGLTRQRPDKHTAQQTEQIIENLKSPKTPLPKKRQIMFSVFGDYRKKIQDKKTNEPKESEETQLKVFPVKRKQQKSVFLRVSQGRDSNDSSLNSAQHKVCQEVISGLPKSTSWKFEPSSANDFRFNFDETE